MNTGFWIFQAVELVLLAGLAARSQYWRDRHQRGQDAIEYMIESELEKEFPTES